MQTDEITGKAMEVLFQLFSGTSNTE